MSRDWSKQQKEMTVLREGESVWDQRRNDHALIKDYSLKHRVTMSWDLNDEAKRDRIFKLTIDDYEVLLDWEEFLRSARMI
jgi:hypothetical protein